MWNKKESEMKDFSVNLFSVACPSGYLSVNFFHFYLFLQNHLANFNQTGTNHPWVKGIYFFKDKIEREQR